jgi:response regulator RpfG family c-di-GMP phosphodiesterase
MLKLRKSTLEMQGYSVRLASNGYDAIKTLEEASVAAVLLEYKQEGMDAEAVACHIKQRFPSLGRFPTKTDHYDPRCGCSLSGQLNWPQASIHHQV